MRIATILGAFSVGSRPLDIATAYTSDRGLTGTELGFLRVSEELRKLGHWVVPFIGHANPREEWANYDALLSWNEPNLLRGITGPKRICFQMLNDFSFVQPEVLNEDITHVGVSQGQVDHITKHYPQTAGKWGPVVPLGCDPELYEDRRVPGRVIYASSPDRGLHWLLEMWPDIKKAVPETHLRIFYHWSYDNLLHVTPDSVSPQGGPYHPHILEIAQRARYMKHAMEVLKPLGVEYIGSVSRERMAREYSEASVFAYPCDPVAFSEGFSCSTLEACASPARVIVSDADCLGDIYRDSGAHVVPRGEWGHFAGAVQAALEFGPLLPTLPNKERAFAERHTWANTAKQLEGILRG